MRTTFFSGIMKSMLIEDIRQQIRQARHRLGWSQVQLAKEAKVAEQTVVNIERGYGQPNWGTLEKVWAALEQGAAQQAE